MKKYKVEILSKADAPEIVALFKKVWPDAKEYPKAWRLKRTLSLDQILDEIKNGYYYFGIRINGELAGLYKAHIEGETIFGEHQSILPQFRRRGLAIIMYRQLIEFAKKTRCKRVYVNCLSSQIASNKCAKELGFHKKGELWEQTEGMFVQTYEKEL